MERKQDVDESSIVSGTTNGSFPYFNYGDDCLHSLPSLLGADRALSPQIPSQDFSTLDHQHHPYGLRKKIRCLYYPEHFMGSNRLDKGDNQQVHTTQTLKELRPHEVGSQRDQLSMDVNLSMRIELLSQVDAQTFSSVSPLVHNVSISGQTTLNQDHYQITQITNTLEGQSKLGNLNGGQIHTDTSSYGNNQNKEINLITSTKLSENLDAVTYPAGDSFVLPDSISSNLDVRAGSKFMPASGEVNNMMVGSESSCLKETVSKCLESVLNDSQMDLFDTQTGSEDKADIPQTLYTNKQNVLLSDLEVSSSDQQKNGMSEPENNCSIQQKMGVTEPENNCSVHQKIGVTEQEKNCSVQQKIGVTEQENNCSVQQKIGVTEQENNSSVQQKMSVAKPENNCSVQQKMSVAKPENNCSVQQKLVMYKPENNCSVQQRMDTSIPENKSSQQKIDTSYLNTNSQNLQKIDISDSIASLDLQNMGMSDHGTTFSNQQKLPVYNPENNYSKTLSFTSNAPIDNPTIDKTKDVLTTLKDPRKAEAAAQRVGNDNCSIASCSTLPPSGSPKQADTGEQVTPQQAHPAHSCSPEPRIEKGFSCSTGCNIINTNADGPLLLSQESNGSSLMLNSSHPVGSHVISRKPNVGSSVSLLHTSKFSNSDLKPACKVVASSTDELPLQTHSLEEGSPYKQTTEHHSNTDWILRQHTAAPVQREDFACKYEQISDFLHEQSSGRFWKTRDDLDTAYEQLGSDCDEAGSMIFDGRRQHDLLIKSPVEDQQPHARTSNLHCNLIPLKEQASVECCKASKTNIKMSASSKTPAPHHVFNEAKMKTQNCSKQKVNSKDLQSLHRLVDLYDKMLDKLNSGCAIDGKSQLNKFEQILTKLKSSHEKDREKLLSSSNKDGRKDQRSKQKLMQEKQAVLELALEKHELLKQRVLTIQTEADKLKGTILQQLQRSTDIDHTYHQLDNNKNVIGHSLIKENEITDQRVNEEEASTQGFYSFPPMEHKGDKLTNVQRGDKLSYVQRGDKLSHLHRGDKYVEISPTPYRISLTDSCLDVHTETPSAIKNSNRNCMNIDSQCLDSPTCCKLAAPVDWSQVEFLDSSRNLGETVILDDDSDINDNIVKGAGSVMNVTRIGDDTLGNLIQNVDEVLDISAAATTKSSTACNSSEEIQHSSTSNHRDSPRCSDSFLQQQNTVLYDGCSEIPEVMVGSSIVKVSSNTLYPLKTSVSNKEIIGSSSVEVSSPPLYGVETSEKLKPDVSSLTLNRAPQTRLVTNCIPNQNNISNARHYLADTSQTQTNVQNKSFSSLGILCNTRQNLGKRPSSPSSTVSSSLFAISSKEISRRMENRIASQQKLSNIPNQVMPFMNTSLPNKITQTKMQITYQTFGLQSRGIDNLASQASVVKQSVTNSSSEAYQATDTDAFQTSTAEKCLQTQINTPYPNGNSAIQTKVLMPGKKSRGRSNKKISADNGIKETKYGQINEIAGKEQREVYNPSVKDSITQENGSLQNLNVELLSENNCKKPKLDIIQSKTKQPYVASSGSINVALLISSLRTVRLIADGEVTGTSKDFSSDFWNEDFANIRMSESFWNTLDVW